jgi:hypothetical protein
LLDFRHDHGSPAIYVKDELIESMLFFRMCLWDHPNFCILIVLQRLSRKTRVSLIMLGFTGSGVYSSRF